MGLCVILVYFFNTGCLLYPVQQTCISGIEWGIPRSEVSNLNTHYQWWAKAGGGPGYTHEMEKNLYIKNFNWLSNWIDKYFFNKMTDFLAGLSFILIVLIITFKSKNTSIHEEGCLSLPGHFAKIERPAECHLDYIDYYGKKKNLKAEGILATCVQHEVDHLNGVLFVDYLSKLKKDMIIKKLIKQKKDTNKIIL